MALRGAGEGPHSRRYRGPQRNGCGAITGGCGAPRAGALTQPAIWFGASPFCPGNCDMPDLGRYKRNAVKSGVWVDTTLFRLASICCSAPGFDMVPDRQVWLKSGSLPWLKSGSLRPGPAAPHSCSGLLWLKYGGGTARLMRHKSGCDAGELRYRVSAPVEPQTLPVL